MDGGGFEDAEDVDGEEGIDGACKFIEEVRSGSTPVGGGAKLGRGEWDGDCWTRLMVVMVCL